MFYCAFWTRLNQVISYLMTLKYSILMLSFYFLQWPKTSHDWKMPFRQRGLYTWIFFYKDSEKVSRQKMQNNRNIFWMCLSSLLTSSIQFVFVVHFFICCKKLSNASKLGFTYDFTNNDNHYRYNDILFSWWLCSHPVFSYTILNFSQPHTSMHIPTEIELPTNLYNAATVQLS